VYLFDKGKGDTPMFRIIGFIAAGLLVLVTAPYWFRLLNKYVLRIPAKKVLPLSKALRAIHKPLGIALLLIAATHGYLALRSIRLHTGTLAWLSFAVTACLGIAFYFTKKKPVFRLHKLFALLSALLVLLHLLFPGALYYILY